MEECSQSQILIPPRNDGCFGDGITTPKSAEEVDSDDRERGRCAAALVDEIQQLSDSVRRALECPVCKELSGTMYTCYDNGHGLCDECSWTLNRLHPQSPKCPLCRSPTARLDEDNCPQSRPPPTPLMPVYKRKLPASTRKLQEFMSVVKVTCSYRADGCPYLVYVLSAAAHESLCPHAPHVRCMVPCCSWSGAYGDAFHHVASNHQFSAYDVLENQFLMPDLSYGLHGTMRRAYLTRNVKDSDRLYWVCFSQPTMAGIEVAVLKVFDPDAPTKYTCRPPDMVFRVKTMCRQGWPRQSCRPRSVCWDRVVLDQMSRVLADGDYREKFITTLHTPPWCTATVRDGMQYEAIITWTTVTQ